jgi:uncharacterized surface protein with fasciclin (FAS1) repeats
MNENKNGLWIGLGGLVIVGLIVGGIIFFTNRNNDNNEVANNQTNSMSEQASEVAKTNTIVDVASSDPNFSTLVTAVKAAGLVETLSGQGPFTVFAPTNEAFNNLPAGTLDNLLANPDQLKAILTYHVVPGSVMAADVAKLPSATTVNGKPVTIAVEGQTVKINDATVTKTDIKTDNGVIHVIDKVLLPPQ